MPRMTFQRRRRKAAKSSPRPLPPMDKEEGGSQPQAASSSQDYGPHGCPHYQRRCKLVAPCCGEVFACRHCHNDAKHANEPDLHRRHELDRSLVQELVCSACDLRQPVATHCRGCHVQFGAYSCLKCNFFDDDTSKGQFHCDECGLCRVGGAENYFHCKCCGCCYGKSLQDNHVCVENSMKQNCPICIEYLFDSVRQTSILHCGHTIHSACLQELEASSSSANPAKCPVCSKSLDNYSEEWMQLDREIAEMPMPPDYASWMVDILCNDCNQTSHVSFHVLGLCCQHCWSYNTRRIVPLSRSSFGSLESVASHSVEPALPAALEAAAMAAYAREPAQPAALDSAPASDAMHFAALDAAFPGASPPSDLHHPSQ